MRLAKSTFFVLLASAGCVEPRVAPTTATVPSSERTQVVVPATPVAPAPAVAPTPLASSGAGAPMHVSWVVDRFDGHRASLRARVERVPSLALPLMLTVTVPPGAALVVGSRSVSLPPPSPNGPTEFTYELTYASTPSEDLLVAVDGESEAMGVHGRASFRFGRAEPETPVALPTGPSLILNGRNFGPSVPVTQ